MLRAGDLARVAMLVLVLILAGGGCCWWCCWRVAARDREMLRPARGRERLRGR